MNFAFLHSYKIDPLKVDISEAKEIGTLRHLFYAVPEIDIKEALTTFNPFPVELLNFYNELGFGFFHRRKGKLNILLDPMSLVNTNLRLGYFKEDPFIMEAFRHFDNEKQLLFFKTHAGQYLSIDRAEKQGKNAIYYKNKQIESSLYDFLYNYSKNIDYPEDFIEEKTKNKERKTDLGNIKSAKRVGGHVLIDPY